MRLSLLGSVIDLDTSQLPSRMQQRLERAWSASLFDGDADSPVDAHLRILPSDSLESSQCGPQDLIVPAQAPDITYMVSQHVTRTIIELGAGSLLMLHAAGLAHPQTGEAIGIIAPSGTGKTTFCETLGLSLDYLTDETLGVRPETLMAVPYPKPLSIVRTAPQARKEDHAAVDLGLVAVTDERPLTALVIAERAASGNELVPISLLEAISRAIPQSSSLYALECPLGTLARALTLAGGPWVLRFSNQLECADLVRGLPTRQEEAEPFTHVPGNARQWDARGASSPLRHTSLGPLAENDRFERGRFHDAIVTEEGVVVLVDRRPITLTGIGAAVWAVTDTALSVKDIHQRVLRRHGHHSGSWKLVSEGISALLTHGLLSPVTS